MRERGIAFLLALASLVAFYGLWLRPEPSLDSDADIARPTTAERRGNGYAALYAWLERSQIEVYSLRERYGSLQELDIPPRGNLLILSLPAVEVFRSDELSALDEWVRRGNTLLINAALLDQPAWAARRSAGAVVEIESLTAIEFETQKSRAERLDDTPLSQRVREADQRDAKREDDEDAEPLTAVAADESIDGCFFCGAFRVLDLAVLRAAVARAALRRLAALAVDLRRVPAFAAGLRRGRALAVFFAAVLRRDAFFATVPPVAAVRSAGVELARFLCKFAHRYHAVWILRPLSSNKPSNTRSAATSVPTRSG